MPFSQFSASFATVAAIIDQAGEGALFPFNTASRVELRAEIFNILNTTNFGTPAANISNSNAGVIASADDARYAQLSLRVVW